MFDATIRGNPRLARPDTTDEELEAAAACARLRPWIASLPPGGFLPARYERFFAVHPDGAMWPGGGRRTVAVRAGAQGSGDSGEVGAD